ncbi:MAG: cyanophycinase [Planctomycetota bacterium]
MQRTPRHLVSSIAFALFASTSAFAQGFLCAEGGGAPTAQGWGATVFGWMVSQTQSAGPSVAIVGVAGADSAAAAAFAGAGAGQILQVAASATSANSSAVAQAISGADIVWIRGGDQAEYIEAWAGTATEAAIRSVYASGGVVGGTSAGCAVLSGIVYDARSGSLPSDAALSDPFDDRMTFTEDFLDLAPALLGDALFDTHFTERGRVARLALQVARLRRSSAGGTDRQVVGYGVDDQTALCVYPDGTAEVLGAGAVTVLRATPEAQERLRPGEAPTLVGYSMDVLTAGYVVDVSTGVVLAASPDSFAPSGFSGPAAFDAVTIRGDLDAHRRRADSWVDDGGDDLALFRGGLVLRDGQDFLRQCVVATRTWESTAFDENRVGGTLWELRQNPGWLGVLIDYETDMAARTDNVLEVRLGIQPATSVLLVDSSEIVTSADSSHVTSSSSVGPRQSVALEGVKLHVLAPGNAWAASASGGGRVLGGEPFGEGKLNSTGRRASLNWSGSSSLAGDGLTLDVEDGVPGQFCVLVSGDQAAQAPYFGATRYFGGQILRHGLAHVDADGTLAFPFAIDAALVGSTRFFQAVIRDPALGVPHPVATTSGLRVTFVL